MYNEFAHREMIRTAANQQAMADITLATLARVQSEAPSRFCETVVDLIHWAEERKYQADQRVKVVELASCRNTVPFLFPDGHVEECYVETNFEHGAGFDPLAGLNGSIEYYWDGKWRHVTWPWQGILLRLADGLPLYEKVPEDVWKKFHDDWWAKRQARLQEQASNSWLDATMAHAPVA